MSGTGDSWRMVRWHGYVNLMHQELDLDLRTLISIKEDLHNRRRLTLNIRETALDARALTR